MLKWTLLLFTAVLLPAQDWICTGGNPQRTGFTPDTLIRPPLKIEWRAKTAGTSNAQPVIAGDMAFIRSLEGYIYGYNRNTGALVWRTYVTASRSSWCSSLSYADGSIYFNTNRGSANEVIRLDAATGTRKWASPSGFVMSQFYSPVVYRGVLYGANYMTTQSAHDGCVFWARDTATGDTLWTYPCPNMDGGFAGPAIDTSRGVLFGSACTVSNARGLTFALDIAGGGHAALWVNDTVSWKRGGDVYNWGGLVYDRDTLYINNPGATGYCLIMNARTGAPLPNTPNAAGSVKSIAVSASHLAYGLYGGQTEIRSRGGALLGSTQNASPRIDQFGGSGGCNSPVIANGFVFRGGGGRRCASPGCSIYAASIDDIVNRRATTMIRYTWQTTTNNCGSPCVAYGKLFIYGTDGWFYCFGNAE